MKNIIIEGEESEVMPVSRQEFDVKLIKPDVRGAWTYFVVPFDVQEAYGSKSRVPVKGTIDGYPYRSSIMPWGGGIHILVVNKTIQKNAGIAAGDVVHVVMELDGEVQTVDLPEDFAEALEKNLAAKAVFEKYPFSHKKEMLDWINDAKKVDTRARRIQKAIASLSEKTPG